LNREKYGLAKYDLGCAARPLKRIKASGLMAFSNGKKLHFLKINRIEPEIAENNV
jgi:hypothetical protein